MQAMAVIEVLKTCERLFGQQGQQAVYEALHRVGLDIGRQILAGTHKPDDMSEAEFLSFYASVINRIAYASLEAPKIDGPDQVSFDILWCPHQDHYQAFDCRVQRYFVEGMIDAMREYGREHDFDVRFDSTIPAVRADMPFHHVARERSRVEDSVAGVHRCDRREGARDRQTHAGRAGLATVSRSNMATSCSLVRSTRWSLSAPLAFCDGPSVRCRGRS